MASDDTNSQLREGNFPSEQGSAVLLGDGDGDGDGATILTDKKSPDVVIDMIEVQSRSNSYVLMHISQRESVLRIGYINQTSSRLPICAYIR